MRSAESAPSAYHQALDFLHARIDWERAKTIPYSGRDFKLGRMRRLLDLLGHPERELPIVHVAGTKGKGSTSAMITAALTAAGYRVGQFISPHLDRVEERLAVDAQPCSPDEFVALVDHVRPVVEVIDRETVGPGEFGPTYFELTTAMALMHFVRRGCDLAVLEVGLGGRLDSTNVCTPRVAVITSISFDHMKQLGDTLAEIAAEKAGIVKPGVPLISGVTQDEPREVIRQACRRAGAPLHELGVNFDFRYFPPRDLQKHDQPARLDFIRDLRPADGRSPSGAYRDSEARRQPVVHHEPSAADDASEMQEIKLPLAGRHQAANAAVAMATLDALRRGGWRIPTADVRRGLAALDWPARAQVVARNPAVVLDVAHNPASVAALVELLGESFNVGRRHLIFAATLEKDARGMLVPLLKHFDSVALTRYVDNPRAVPPGQLADMCAEIADCRPPVFDQPLAAWRWTRDRAGSEDLICVTGSFFIVTELRPLIAAAMRA